jgi:hypothetical protein
MATITVHVTDDDFCFSVTQCMSTVGNIRCGGVNHFPIVTLMHCFVFTLNAHVYVGCFSEGHTLLEPSFYKKLGGWNHSTELCSKCAFLIFKIPPPCPRYNDFLILRVEESIILQFLHLGIAPIINVAVLSVDQNLCNN